MDQGTIWLERLSSWMEKREEDSFEYNKMLSLSDDWNLASEETDTLLHFSLYLETAFSQIIGKYDDEQRPQERFCNFDSSI